jgi:hypothetical protein
MTHTDADSPAELTLAPEWTVFGPCAETDPTPLAADLASCPTTLRLGGQELAPHKVKASGQGVNLGKLFGGFRERLGAWVFIPVIAPRDGRYRIGLGADWWLEAFLDGQPLKSTLAAGNGKVPPAGRITWPWPISRPANICWRCVC